MNLVSEMADFMIALDAGFQTNLKIPKSAIFLFPHFSHSHTFTFSYSVLNDFTGLATAALIAWKQTVNNAIQTASKPASANIHQLSGIL